MHAVAIVAQVCICLSVCSKLVHIPAANCLKVTLMYILLAVFRGSYVQPSSRYSYELRNVIAELFRRNPR